MARQPHPITSAYRQALAAAADPDKASGMQSYMKSTMPYRGVTAPVAREIQRNLFKQYPLNGLIELERVVRELWQADYREERYGAIALARRYQSLHTLELLPLFRMMIVSGAWWDYVDAIAAYLIGGLLKNHPVEMKMELKRWIRDEDLWIRRTAILSQLNFKESVDEKMLFDFCNRCLSEESFWIRKATGWALRQHARVAPDAVRAFIDQNSERMSNLTKREAAKHL